MSNLEHNKQNEELDPPSDKVNFSAGITNSLKRRRMPAGPSGPSGPPVGVSSKMPKGRKKKDKNPTPVVEHKPEPEKVNSTKEKIQNEIDAFVDQTPNSLTKENYKEYMKGPTLFMVSGDACEPCKRMYPIWPRLESYYKGKLKTVKWNANSGDKRIRHKLPRLVKEPDIVPTLYIIRNGKFELLTNSPKPLFSLVKDLKSRLGLQLDSKHDAAIRTMTIKYQPINVFVYSGRFPEYERRDYLDMAFERALKIYPGVVFKDPALILGAGISKKRFMEAVRKYPKIALSRNVSKKYQPHYLCMEMMEIAAKEEPKEFVRIWSREVRKHPDSIHPKRLEPIKQLLEKYKK